MKLIFDATRRRCAVTRGVECGRRAHVGGGLCARGSAADAEGRVRLHRRAGRVRGRADVAAGDKRDAARSENRVGSALGRIPGASRRLAKLDVLDWRKLTVCPALERANSRGYKTPNALKRRGHRTSTELESWGCGTPSGPKSQCQSEGQKLARKMPGSA
ncbi:hypothetical protein BDY21DRAFT_157263 [Lineolata rhizophorae]|uniref:Uncharacterized protein n=1 Tax=Lineolata rhizophorae TaxID=578093 RepID=A0A6A6NM48_9PEZI|nr:hypothetical protein BDY21DRAFT_157263 [Lineolata rhizophorae]